MVIGDFFNDSPLMILPSRLSYLMSTEIDAKLISKSVSLMNKVEHFGSTAILSIKGDLMHDVPEWVEEYFGVTSTSRLHDTFMSLDSDPSVKIIVLDIDSPGGSSLGGFEFAADVYKSNKTVAWSSGYMTSLAYLIGSAARGGVFTTPSAQVGSIGVISQIPKFSNSDVKVYTFKGGKEKDYGNPYAEMEEEELKYFQERVDRLYNEFVIAVSVYRDWNPIEVKNTEARHEEAAYIGGKFVDGIMSKQEFLSKLNLI